MFFFSLTVPSRVMACLGFFGHIITLFGAMVALKSCNSGEQKFYFVKNFESYSCHILAFSFEVLNAQVSTFMAIIYWNIEARENVPNAQPASKFSKNFCLASFSWQYNIHEVDAEQKTLQNYVWTSSHTAPVTIENDLSIN